MPRPLRSRLWPSLTRFWQRDESLTLGANTEAPDPAGNMYLVFIQRR